MKWKNSRKGWHMGHLPDETNMPTERSAVRYINRFMTGL